MSLPTLTKTSLQNGTWKGIISGVSEMPEIAATHLETPVPGVRVIPGGTEGDWLLEIPVPLAAITDGMQTVLIQDADTEALLGSFTLMAGEVLGDDLRAEVELLRAELDMLKRAFRRHCLETGA